MEITTVGIDLAKNVFQVHGVRKRGKADLRRQLRRHKVAAFFANLPPCLIGMEAWAAPIIGPARCRRTVIPCV